MENHSVCLSHSDIILITSLLGYLSGNSYIAFNAEVVKRCRELYDVFSKISI